VKRHPYAVIVSLAAAVGLLFHAPALSGAGPSISGTVAVTGAASNADVVVYVQQTKETGATAKAEMNQSKMQFIPHVLPVVAGSTVDFLNSDPTAHNVFSPDGEKFNLGTWQKGTTKPYTFNKCTKFPCVYTLLCRVHPEMEGYIVVLQNPYFAVSGKDGHYTIEDVPPGSYTLAVWHQKAKAQPKPVTVAAGKVATADFVLSR
jgi:plastocyanin